MVEWNLSLHSGGQSDVFDCQSRFVVVAAGTRWGKSHLCANKVINYGLDNQGKLIWWVAPTFELAEVGREKILLCGIPELFKKENRQRKILPMVSGADIQFKSADNPDSLLGRGIGYLVIDEAARILDDVWYSYLRRTLLDHKGPAIMISTPKGKNWFYDLWLKGQDSAKIEFKSFKFKTEDNPFIDKREIAQMRLEVPELVARQELDADFMDDASTVFRGIDACATGEFKEPTRGMIYTVGVDVAKYQDFWVSVVMDSLNRVVAFDRSNKLDWRFQEQRLSDLVKRYNNAKIIIDSTGVGDPIYEDFARAGFNVEPFVFGSNKKQLIENLALLIERNEITFPPIPELINELKSFEYTLSASNNVRYNAPSGKHDDCVIGLALACWGLKTPQPRISIIG